MMNKRLLFTVILVSILFVSGEVNFIFAQTQGENELQLINNKIDRLINFIAMIATIFGVIVAIVVAFFAIRQINVDREIKAYKEDILRQKKLIEEETKETKKRLIELRKWTGDQKKEIKKALSKPISKRTKKELERLEEKIERLRENIDIKRGSLMVSGTTDTITADTITTGPIGVLPEILLCSKCHRTYLYDPTRINPKECPYCGHSNI